MAPLGKGHVRVHAYRVVELQIPGCTWVHDTGCVVLGIGMRSARF
jgi:hypothetical protein